MPFETLHVGTKPRMSCHQLPGGGKDEKTAIIIQTNTGMGGEKEEKRAIIIQMNTGMRGEKDEAMVTIIQTNTGMVSQSKKCACGIHICVK